MDIIQKAIKKGCKCSNNGRHLQDIQAWLRNEHDIHVQPIIYLWSDRTYQFRIHSSDRYCNSAQFLDNPIIGTHDEVLEKGIIEALHML